MWNFPLVWNITLVLVLTETVSLAFFSNGGGLRWKQMKISACTARKAANEANRRSF